MIPLAQPPKKDDRSFDDWMYRMWKRISSAAGIAWSLIDKTGANLTDIPTRHHDDLQYIPASPIINLEEDVEEPLFIPPVWSVLDKNGANLKDIPIRHHDDLQYIPASPIINMEQDYEEHPFIPPRDSYDFDHVTFPASRSIGNIGHIYTLSDLMNHEWSSGIVDGAILTDNGNGTISIGTSIGVLRAVNDGHTNFYGFLTQAQLNIALTDNATNYIYISYNAGNPIFVATTNFADMDGTTKVLTYVVHRLGTVLHTLDVRDQNVDTINKITTLFSKFSNFIHAQGGTALGSNGLAVTVTAGSFFYQLQEKPHVAFDTSVAGTANANVFGLWYRNGVGGWIEVPNSKVVNTTVYDNNTGTPVTLGNNKFGVTWFYIVNDSPSELHAVMGEFEYANLASTAAASPPGTLPSILSGLGSLIGYVAYQKGNTVFDNVFSAFVANFVAAQPTIHNGLSGLQGGSGTTSEFFHFTDKEHLKLQQLLSQHVGYFPQVEEPEDNTWIPGPPGNQGPTGATGATGPQGQQGPIGFALNGEDGESILVIQSQPATSTSSIIWEPMLASGSGNNDVIYNAGTSLVPDFLLANNGDIMLGVSA